MKSRMPEKNARNSSIFQERHKIFLNFKERQTLWIPFG